MKKFLMAILLVTLVCSLTFGATAKTAEETFILFIEAEDCVMDGYWVVDGNAGAVGKMITCDTANDQKFTVNFNVPADGKYTVWFKVWHVSPGGTDENSVFFDYNGETHVFDFDEDAGTTNSDYFMLKRWYWIQINRRGSEPLQNGWSTWGEEAGQCRHTPVIMDLKAGANSITFTSREPGHFIDQIIITDNLEYNPADVPGNNTYICTFCNLPHFEKEPYADFGKTPEQYWNAQFVVEVVEEPADAADIQEAVTLPATVTPTAPQTADIIIVSLAAFALAGSIISRRRKVK